MPACNCIESFLHDSTANLSEGRFNFDEIIARNNTFYSSWFVSQEQIMMLHRAVFLTYYTTQITFDGN